MTIDCDKTLGSKLQYSRRELDEDNLCASSKVILAAQFSEIKTDSGSFIHSVQLILTTDWEIIVLKLPTDKSTRRSSLRKHNICGTEFTVHNFLPNSLMATVPGTILRYSYQLQDNQKPTIGEWLEKIRHCKFSKKSKTVKTSLPDRESTSTAGQSTSYENTDTLLHTNSYSSPSAPIQRSLPLPLSSIVVSTSVDTIPCLGNDHSRIVQMPSGLIKARSFQDRGSVKEHFVRKNSSSLDLNKQVNTVNSEVSTPRTPSPLMDENPFEGQLRHTQVRNKKRIFSPRGGSRNAVNPVLEKVKERRYYSRSVNSTPLPGLNSSLVIASPSAEAR